VKAMESGALSDPGKPTNFLNPSTCMETYRPAASIFCFVELEAKVKFRRYALRDSTIAVSRVKEDEGSIVQLLGMRSFHPGRGDRSEV
jgi:hypothetical protein